MLYDSNACVMTVSKPILDEAGLIACMAYIDLNPVRANMTDSIEDSKYTSIVKRIKQKEIMLFA